MARLNVSVLAGTCSGAFDAVTAVMILRLFAFLSALDAVVTNLMLVYCGFRAPV